MRTVKLWAIQRVLRQSAQILPTSTEVALLADRGFADGKLVKYLQETLHWHFRIRIKRSFQFQLEESFLDLKSNGFNLEASRSSREE
ncbi:MAG: hypothetical protein AAFQ80_24230 [Cyanobacteria bacterium J06621_8]